MDLVNSRWGKVLDIGNVSITLQLTGTIDFINESIELLKNMAY